MSQRNAKEPVLDGIIGLSSGVYAFGLVALPPSLASSPTLGRISTVVLFIGCVAALIGYVWPHRDDGMSIQQGAQPLIFVGAVVYAIALAQTPSPVSNFLLAFAFVAAVGAAAVARWIQLRHRIRQRTKEAVRLNGELNGRG